MLTKSKTFFVNKVKWIFLLVIGILSIWAALNKMRGDGWRYTIYMDGRGYYAQLPAFLIYNDPAYEFYSSQSAVINDEPSFLNEIDGKYVNKYFCGEPFLQLPFFTAGHLIAKSFGYKANGYSEPYFYCIAFGALFYFLLGLFFLWKLLEKFSFRKPVILIVCICFAAGTNLFHYAEYEPSMSHIYSFAAVAGFLYFMRCFFLSPSRKYILLSAAALGIVALLRPVNLVVLLAFPAMAGNWENVKAGFRWMGKNVSSTMISVVIFSIICSVQLLIYYWHTGKFFVWAYSGEGFDFAHPHFFGTLFSYEKGLFVYMPMTLLALFGFFIIAKRSPYLLFTLLPLLALIAWIVSSWHEWRYGYSFGLRAYIDYYALFALPLAFLVDFAFRRKLFLAPVVLTCLLFILLYGIQEYQFQNRILHAGAMNKEAYWMVFLKTSDEYQDLITEETQLIESDGDFNDMEGNVKWLGHETIVADAGFSGNHSSRIDSVFPYSCAFVRNMSRSEMFDHPTRLLISAQILRKDTSGQAMLSVAQVRNNNTYFLYNYPLPLVKTNGEWQQITHEVLLPGKTVSNQMLKVFFVHKKGELYIDDLKVQVKEK